MAKNRQPEKPADSQSESIEEDEEASSEEVDSQESESEPEPESSQVPKKGSVSTPATQKQPPGKAPQQPESSSSEEETGSESESESEGPDLNVRPLASRPMDEVEKSNAAARKPRSKANAAEPATPTRSTAGKRSAEEKDTAAKDAKKSRTSDPEGSEKKSSLFQRIWSEEDEIVILKGMIDYASKKKVDPVKDLNAFLEFIKKNLHVDVNSTQLQHKIRRMKKKYENNKSKEKNGKARIFSKPHEQKAYELSKLIWGGKENGAEKVVGSPKANGGSVVRRASGKRAVGAAETEEVSNAKSAEVVVGEGGTLLLARSVNSGGGSVEERVMKVGAELYEASKGLEGEKDWKKLRVEEIELYLKQLEVKAAQTRLVLDVLKSADH